MLLVLGSLFEGQGFIAHQDDIEVWTCEHQKESRFINSRVTIPLADSLFFSCGK